MTSLSCAFVLVFFFFFSFNFIYLFLFYFISFHDYFLFKMRGPQHDSSVAQRYAYRSIFSTSNVCYILSDFHF